MATGTGLSGKSNIKIDIKNLSNLTTKLKETIDDLSIDTSIKWSFGTGVKQANVLFHEKLTIAQSANQTLDLYASGALKDVFGNLLTMEAIKLLYIYNRSTSLIVSVFGGGANDLLIMGGTTDSMKVQPEGSFLWQCPTAAGIVTTANKNLYLAVSAGSGSAIIDVVALGND